MGEAWIEPSTRIDATMIDGTFRLSNRARKALAAYCAAAKIATFGDLCQRTVVEMLRAKGIGRRYSQEIASEVARLSGTERGKDGRLQDECHREERYQRERDVAVPALMAGGRNVGMAGIAPIPCPRRSPYAGNGLGKQKILCLWEAEIAGYLEEIGSDLVLLFINCLEQNHTP